ncbi:MAG: DUF3822 family protein [Bacteroidetes bacterium]|nr:MAG: DUF3822 family protein [Bacteroidota bacterium]
MSEVKTSPAASIDLIDESFDPKKSNTYHLSMLSNGKKLSYAILDTNTNKYLVLSSQTETFPKFETLEKLGSNFKSVTCAVAHPKFTLIPSALFDIENKNSLLAFNHPIEKGEKTHSDTLRGMDAKNLFTISEELESAVKKQFPKAHVVHNSTAFIEGLLLQNKNSRHKKVFANLHSNYFEIVILEGGELLFSNAFQYKTAEDIAYYILFVYEQLHLNPEEIELTLSGEIEKTAQEHTLLYNYIRHVKFASFPDSFKYSYKFEDVPSHKFWTLFTQYLTTA